MRVLTGRYLSATFRHRPKSQTKKPPCGGYVLLQRFFSGPVSLFVQTDRASGHIIKATILELVAKPRAGEGADNNRRPVREKGFMNRAGTRAQNHSRVWDGEAIREAKRISPEAIRPCNGVIFSI